MMHVNFLTSKLTHTKKYLLTMVYYFAVFVGRGYFNCKDLGQVEESQLTLKFKTKGKSIINLST